MENKQVIWKRVVAYAIDILLITLVVSMFSSVKLLNPRIDNYNKEYKEYVTLTEKYQDKKITKKKYEIQYNKIYYKLQQNSVYYNIIYLVMIILYFGLFQYFTKGQTIGKKLMKIKVVSKDDKKELNIFNYILRSLLLYSTIYYVLLTIGVFIFNAGIYSHYATGIYYANMVLELIIIYLVFTRSDMRGLHDIVANTKVISTEELKENNDKVIIDAKIEEKPKKEKSSSAKTKSSKKKITKNKKIDE